MKNYVLIEEEVYPVIQLHEVKEGGQPIPSHLVRRLKDAERRWREAEEAILVYTGEKEGDPE